MMTFPVFSETTVMVNSPLHENVVNTARTARSERTRLRASLLFFMMLPEKAKN